MVWPAKLHFRFDGYVLFIVLQCVVNVALMQWTHYPEAIGVRIREDLPQDPLSAHIILSLIPTIPLLFWRTSRIAQMALRQKELAEAEALHIALHDPLTGLGNRRMFTQTLDQWLTQSRRPAIALLLIDLDGFKEVNDQLGHEAGDLVLLNTAQRMRLVTDESMVCTRMGGDEFAILVAAPDAADIDTIASELATALCDIIRTPVAITPDVDAIVTASIGISLMSATVDPTDMLRAADQAMYSAKKAGKDAWQIYGAKRETPAHKAKNANAS